MYSIVVAEDESIISMQIEKFIQGMGHVIAGLANTGEEAIRLAEQTRPDLMIMDIKMPGTLDGIQASAIIKNELDIPIVFVTAFSGEEYIHRVMGVHPAAFIVKPFHEAELHAAIEIAMQNKTSLAELNSRIKPLESMIYNSADPFISMDRNGSIMQWNKSAEEFFSYDVHSVEGQSISAFFNRQDRISVFEALKYFIPDPLEPNISKKVDIDLINKDGESFPMRMTLSSFTAEGETYINCLAQKLIDAQEQDKQPGDEHNAESLLETRNRFQIILTIISNLIKIQYDFIKDGTSATAALKGCSVKVFALESLYNQLCSAKNGQGVDSVYYIKLILRNLFIVYAQYNSRISLDLGIEHIALSFYQSIVCGLIVNELVANSLQHAFPDNREGRVFVGLQKNPNQDRCVLTIRDNGIGLPAQFDIYASDTFGFQLIIFLTTLMGGTIAYDSDGATEFTITFPCSA